MVDDQNEHAQPDASQTVVFDEVWWNNYQAQVTKSILAAEKHLEVPVGTISSIPNDPDFVAAVKTYAVVEPILNDLIASWQTPQYSNPFAALLSDARENFRTFVATLNIRGPTGKLRLAQGLGLLPQHQIAFIRAVAQVRNRYAHNVKNMHRSLTDILMEEQRNDGRIAEHLTGIKFALSPSPPQWRNDLLKLLMYYRLADYLAEALNTLRPPPPPESGRGILSALFTKAPPADRK